MKSKKILTGVLASSIAILGLSVYSYSLFDSHAENPAVVEEKKEEVTKKTSPKKEAVVAKEESEKQPDKKVVEKEEKEVVVRDAFKGFERVPYTIQGGDNAWSIQSSLTPNENIEEMLKMVAETNQKPALHPIFPGDKIYFLKDAVKDVASSSTEETESTEPSDTETASTDKEVKTSPSDTDGTVTTASAEQKTSAPKEKQTTSTPEEKQSASTSGETQTTEKPDTKPAPPVQGNAPTGVKIDNQTSTSDIIAMAKKENNSSQKTVTIQYSPDVIVTLNNETRTGEVKRNYTYSQDIVEYGTKVDYQVVDTALEGSKAVIHVISPDAGSQAMFDISNELSALVKSSNGQVTSTDVYFYDNQTAVNARNHKWSYSDVAPNKMAERKAFSF